VLLLVASSPHAADALRTCELALAQMWVKSCAQGVTFKPNSGALFRFLASPKPPEPGHGNTTIACAPARQTDELYVARGVVVAYEIHSPMLD